MVTLIFSMTKDASVWIGKYIDIWRRKDKNTFKKLLSLLSWDMSNLFRQEVKVLNLATGEINSEYW